MDDAGSHGHCSHPGPRREPVRLSPRDLDRASLCSFHGVLLQGRKGIVTHFFFPGNRADQGASEGGPGSQQTWWLQPLVLGRFLAQGLGTRVLPSPSGKLGASTTAPSRATCFFSGCNLRAGSALVPVSLPLAGIAAPKERGWVALRRPLWTLSLLPPPDPFPSLSARLGAVYLTPSLTAPSLTGCSSLVS